MNGAHDLGGKHGHGSIDRSQTEHFPQAWEERVFGLTLACGMLGKWNLDQSRFARERCDPAEYLASTYYQHWLHGLELLLVEKGLVTEAELKSGQSESETEFVAVAPANVDRLLAAGAPTLLPAEGAAAFCIGDSVVVERNNPSTHTRVPDYIRGCIGKVISHHGAHVFADEHSATGQRQAQHLYGVRFEASELWGEKAGARSAVYVDLFEPYLSPLADAIARLAQIEEAK